MHPRDNVIWKALDTCQAHLGTVNRNAGKFFEDVSLLGALAEPRAKLYQSLSPLLKSGERVGLFLEDDPRLPAAWKLVSCAPLLEMICEHGTVPNNKEEPQQTFVRLGDRDVPEMLALTTLTKPGPFGKRTHEMGEYWGIRQNGMLIAMTGERLRLPGFTEVSAVCTHPDHLGRGYATALMNMLIQRILSRGEIPFLHVRPENRRAVNLYQRLGFHERVLMKYVILEKSNH